MDRRIFIKALGAAGVTCETALAAPKNLPSADRMGVLVDTTVCIGCRKCEWACKLEHGLPTPPIESFEDRSVFQNKRRPDNHSLTVVNQYARQDGNAHPTTVKVQCMHWDYPACVSACIVGAFVKTDLGPVLWDTDKCIGCRYCMVACPFQIPSFEYDKALNPQIMKCDFCFERTKEVLLPDLGTKPAPGVSESIQHGIFAYFVPPASLYALLAGIMWLNKKKKESGE